MWGVVVILAFVTCSQAAHIFDKMALPIPTALSESRIVGGKPTTIEKYPYMAQVLYRNNFNCGASLLTRRHVLSAAHCFFTRNNTRANSSDITIRVGTHLVNSGGSEHAVSALMVHEDYDPSNAINDIAVVLLKADVTISEKVRPALIAEQDSLVPDNSTVIAVGWGRTIPNIKKPSPVLNELEMRRISFPQCLERYMYLVSVIGESFGLIPNITINVICAGMSAGEGVCYGDSGGPLIYEGVVVGVDSWGYPCALPNFPGVFTKVAKYSSWINETVMGHTAAEGVPSAGIAESLTPLLLILSLPSGYLLIF